MSNPFVRVTEIILGYFAGKIFGWFYTFYILAIIGGLLTGDEGSGIGFLAGLLGLDPDASPVSVAREAQDKITYTDEVPTQQEEVVGGGAAFGPNLGSQVITPDVEALSAEQVQSIIENGINIGQIPGMTKASW